MIMYPSAGPQGCTASGYRLFWITIIRIITYLNNDKKNYAPSAGPRGCTASGLRKVMDENNKNPDVPLRQDPKDALPRGKDYP